jgi:D-amino-acid dehydrogenase
MRIAVLGAGLLGLTTAHFLRRDGAEVTVIERQSGPGLETSHANGGMLHASQANPWNEPGVLWQALRTLGREDAALLIRPRALPSMLGWAVAFFRNAASARYLVNVERNARLAMYSLQVFHAEFRALDAAFACAERGTLKIYRTPAGFESALRLAERCRVWQVPYAALDPDGVAMLEPALAPLAGDLAGGIHFSADCSGDAYLFCVELARRCAAAGVEFAFGRRVDRLDLAGGRFAAVITDGERIAADACVIACGSHTPALTASVGLRVPVQPVKGYSITVPLADWPVAPAVPVIDEDFHAAVCPLGTRLRVAGTAEFAGFDTRLTASRIANLFELVRRLYPRAADRIDPARAEPWCGLRPMTPDGVGIMGASGIPGLFLNTGHGHLGWTMAPGAGKLVAQSVLGQTPDLALTDYALARFGR